MQSHSRAHRSFQTHQLDPANVAITILVMQLFLVFLFVTLTATPSQGQNHVPPTAAQAAMSASFSRRSPINLRRDPTICCS